MNHHKSSFIEVRAVVCILDHKLFEVYYVGILVSRKHAYGSCLVLCVLTANIL